MLRDRVMDEGQRIPGPDRFPKDEPPPVPTGMGAAPDGGDASGSEPPPASAGDDAPTPHFPVPPVPPPPSPGGGPSFGLAGMGGGGAASFARPGSQAAKPFRSPIFNANRSTAAPRFGAGTAVTAGSATTPFLPAGLDGSAESTPADELQRILALMGNVPGGGGGL